MKNEGTRVVTAVYIEFFRRSMAADSVVSSGICPKFKCIQGLMFVYVTCKIEDDPFKYEGARVVTTFLPL